MTLQEQIDKAGAVVPGKPLEEAVRRIVAVADPNKIILFGSAARGTIGHRVITDIYAALADVEPPVEVVLATTEQIERYRDSFGLVF